MSSSLRAFQDLFDVLHGDVESLFNETQRTDSAVLRRSLVRAVFSLFEGIAYAMKQAALRAGGMTTEKFSAAERALLMEEAYTLDNTGRAQVRSATTASLPNIRFAFYAFRKSYEADFELPVSGQGFQSLRQALDVRHRLMHPKSVSHLEISDEEMQTVMTAYRWFISNVVLALKAIVVTLRDITGDENVDEVRLGIIEKRYEPHSK